jgi:hypothetical protein
MTYNSSLVSHFIRETFFLSNHAILKNGIKCLFITRQKMYFKIKLSPSKGASVYKVSSNSETKNFSAQKTPKGLAFKIFWVNQKKKNLFNKCCRACQQESAYKIIQGSGF